MTNNATSTPNAAATDIESQGDPSPPPQHKVEEHVTGQPNPTVGDSDLDLIPAGGRRSGRSISISIRGLVSTVIAVGLAAAGITLGCLYLDTRAQLAAKARQTENSAHAEKVALDYAVRAAEMDFKDLNTWKGKLVAGTSAELNKKLTDAAASMEQILLPMQWVSNAHPLAAKVRSVSGDAYTVDAFVSVNTKTLQAPDPLQSTATYSITLDAASDWQITDVGGTTPIAG